MAAGYFTYGYYEVDAQMLGFEKPRQTRRDGPEVKKLPNQYCFRA